MVLDHELTVPHGTLRWSAERNGRDETVRSLVNAVLCGTVADPYFSSRVTLYCMTYVNALKLDFWDTTSAEMFLNSINFFFIRLF